MPLNFFYLLLKEFLASDPILSEFKAEIIKYIDLEQQINDVPDFFKVGHKALQLNSAPIKLALKVNNDIRYVFLLRSGLW